MSFALRSRLAATTRPSVEIGYRASSSISANTSSTAISVPATVQAGDFLLLSIGWSTSSGQTLTAPSGWTSIAPAIDDQAQVAAQLFWKIASGGDAGSGVPVVISAVGNLTALLSCYFNVNNVSPINAYAGLAEGTTNVLAHASPSVTSTVQNTRIVSVVFDKANPVSTSWTPPSGTTLRAASFNASNPGVTGVCGDDTLMAVGASGTRSWTADSATARAVMWSIVLRPSSTPTGGGSGGGQGGIYIVAAGDIGAQAIIGAGALDERLASRVGRQTPFLKGEHTYSGNNFPSTFAASNAYDGYVYGFPISVLNVKCDWTLLANGGMDSYIATFINSIPAGHICYLIINHEPENDANPAGPAVWRTGQARAANLIASQNDPRCIYAVCHMTYTWDAVSGRTPSDWNPAPEMTQAALDRAVFAPDGYTTVRNVSGTNIDSMASEFSACFASAASWGFTQFAISEHSINNDIGAPIAPIIDWWNNDHLPYLRSLNNFVYYAFYNHSGPASGTNSNLDTPEEEQMFGNFVAEQNDLLV